MSTTTGPNPLRPYYIPPANDYLLDTLSSNSSSASASDAFSRVTSTASSANTSPASVFSSTARDLLSDLDYSDYVDSDGFSFKDAVTSLATKAGTKYVLQGFSQPFEVAILNLQCQFIPKQTAPRKARNVFEDSERSKENGKSYDDDNASTYSDDDEPAYFASNISEPDSPSFKSTSSRVKKPTDRTGYPVDAPDVESVRPPWELELHKTGHIWDMIKTLWAKEGAWGPWKGQNASFIHWILTSTLESWAGSLISALLSIPDPGLGDIADSPFPMASIGVAVAANLLTALALSPLDIVRTRLILTPATGSPRNILPLLRNLPSGYLCPPQLFLPTTLHAVLPSIIQNGKPFFIRHRLGIDPVLSPGTFMAISGTGTLLSKLIRLPLETVLRRGQAEASGPLDKTIVPVGRYAGLMGTMWLIVKEEEGGFKGLEGLFRGWRMEFWPELLLTLMGMGGLGTAANVEGF